nr:hypothetical protein [Tanacetum cinerariifolium]
MRKISESPWRSPIPIGYKDWDVNRFPDGDGDEDEDEKRGWGCNHATLQLLVDLRLELRLRKRLQLYWIGALYAWFPSRGRRTEGVVVCVLENLGADPSSIRTYVTALPSRAEQTHSGYN